MKDNNCPMLSVIIPIYNSEKYLEKCLESVVNQTFTDMEIILVNDGSTDHSLDICNSYQKKDTRIKVISKENGGLIRARKTGLSAAAGKRIGFVDSDDWIEPEMYEVLLRHMEETGCDMISSGITRDYQDENRSVDLFDHYEEGCCTDLTAEIYPTMLFDFQQNDFGLYCTLVNKVFKKEILEEVYAEIQEEVFYGEDALTCYPYCLLCRSIFILHQSFYHYSIRSGSMCSSADQRLAQNSYLLYDGLRNAFLKADTPFIFMRQLQRYMINIERHCLKRLYHIELSAWDQWKFFYPERVFEKKYVIYGAGACGQALYRFLCQNGKEKNMVHWVDKHAKDKIEECAYPISFPDVLRGTEWEILLIAVECESLARQIEDEIRASCSVEDREMIWCEPEHIVPYK